MSISTSQTAGDLERLETFDMKENRINHIESPSSITSDEEAQLDGLPCAEPQEVKSHGAPSEKVQAIIGELPVTQKGHGGGGGHHGGRPNLPPNHPMHPSQFSGDKWSRPALLTLLGSFCVMFCSFGWINCIGIFQDYYLTHQLQRYSESTVSWIVSFELFFMFLGGPIVGKLFDNFGPRHLLMIGTVLHVLGLMMASLSTEYYQFLLSQGVCSPIGASMLFFPGNSSIRCTCD